MWPRLSRYNDVTLLAACGGEITIFIMCHLHAAVLIQLTGQLQVSATAPGGCDTQSSVIT